MGIWSLRQFLQPCGLDPSHGIRALWPYLPVISLRSFAARQILQTDFVNPKHDADNRPVATGPGAPMFIHDSTPVWEWTPMVDPNDQFDTPGVNLVGISGWVVMSPTVALRQGISGGDVPFTHPFGFDWEFYVAPDPQYDCLLASPNKDVTDGDYFGAKQAAKDLGLSLSGVLGVETDQGLIPPAYRVVPSDRVAGLIRVAVFGRWIVDDGEPDFHTEIHPPLLLAGAKQISEDETYSTVVGRPYLVGQEFGDGALREHLLIEAGKTWGDPRYCFPPLIPCSTQIEAHPPIMPKPFRGNPSMSYLVRPFSPRHSPNDKLTMLFHFTVRTGVTVTLSNADSDGVRVSLEMNEQEYKPVPLPPPGNSEPTVSFGDIIDLAGPAWAKILKDIFDVLPNPLLDSGIKTDHYDAPVASSVHDSEVTTVAVDDLGSVAHYSVDDSDSQPFPVYGWLDVRWERH
jgi:hypothetical protein